MKKDFTHEPVSNRAKQEPVNYILCAAIWYDDGKKRSHMPKNIDTGIVVCGHRHCNCFIILNSIFPECDYKYEEKTEQGFLTSEGNFVTRKQAGVIAYNAGQIIEQTETLFSEDLY